MLDVGIGIFICLFVVLGFYEGLFKALLSFILIFVALFFAGPVMSFLANTSPQFRDPHNLVAIVTFAVVWLAIYIVIDVFLTILLKKLFSVSVFMPVDKTLGMVVGCFKGLLIIGILAQLALALPLAPASKNDIKNSTFVRFSIATYFWASPYVKNVVPMVQSWWQQSSKIKVDNTAPAKSEGLSIDQIIDSSNKEVKPPDIKVDPQQKLLEILKQQKLVPDATNQGGPGK